jgi:hypothetical protein
MATGNNVIIGSVRVSSGQQNPVTGNLIAIRVGSEQQNPTRVRNIQYIPPSLDPVYAEINTVFIHANSAYDTANLKFNSSGGTISGNVTINGDFFVNGNTVYTNSQIMLINDNIITLNSNA